MDADPERKRLPPRETLGQAGGNPSPFAALFFGLPLVMFGGALLTLAFGPAELRAEFGNPSAALLGLPGALVTGLGVMFLGSISRGRRLARRIARARELAPDRPWTWDPRWQTDGVRSASRRWGLKTLAFFVLGAMFLTPFNAWAFVYEGPILVVVVVTLFDLLLALALFGLGISVVGLVKYGDPRLRFSSFPFRLGEELSVRLKRPRRLPPDAPVSCTLRCIQEAEEITEDRAVRTVCYQLWAVDTPIDGGDRTIELNIPLPDDDRLTTCLHEASPRYWQLEIRGDAPGLDYFASFLLPIYA